MKSQAAAPTFTNVYAALVAVINTKLPEIGELLCKRLVDQWKRSYLRNQKTTLIATTLFIAHLVNQFICGVMIPMQILALLLDKPTDDSVEVAVNFIKECGQCLSKLRPKSFNGLFDIFRSILQEGKIDKRVQYMIEHLFIVRKSNFEDHPAIIDALDLVEQGDQITHEDLNLEDEYDDEDLNLSGNIFHFDPEFEKHEREYEAIKREILGDSKDSSSEESSEEQLTTEGGTPATATATASVIEAVTSVDDQTGESLKHFKRKVYLTIVSSLSFEECAHKLLKQGIAEQYEMELCKMIVECCAQEKTYRRFYGLLAQRFCDLRQVYRSNMMECFPEQYENCHMLETNKLRNVALLFSHLLHSDAIAWTVLEHVHMNERDTNSSKRIFVKILFKELAEFLGLEKLNSRMHDPDMREFFKYLMPHDDPEDTKFSINFFTSIGLGALTVPMREHLNMLRGQKISSSSASSSSSSDSSSSGSSGSSSDDSSESSSSSSDGSSENLESSGDSSDSSSDS
eukprot:TRINITY_DN12135_c0_g1_i6.p1 TRINITY_DN12135_c0_g1~~TRINITY_DN12135_c0_g1_i6.p1  ORF type:complete len:514 (+),score=102.84 TRINITY_DN12135_c0_g1_i6:1264-2805(+)